MDDQTSTAETPLIWTSKGNLPVEVLQYTPRWEVTAEYVKFVEVYTLDGEIVRENAHAYILKQEAAHVLQQSLT